MLELDPNADYVNMYALATEVLSRIEEYTREWKQMDENDSDWDYFNGLISAYQSVAGMIGVPLELYSIGEDE
jgi:hypothetical protein